MSETVVGDVDAGPPTSAGAEEIYPLGLRVRGRRVVVVGGGAVGTRRTVGLVGAGADVLVVAPATSETIRALAADGTLRWLSRRYREGDLAGAWLVHAATGDTAVDDRVSAEAEADRTWCIRAGDGSRATAWVPAVARGPEGLTLAVNAARDPRRAADLRDLLAPVLHARRPPGAWHPGVDAGTPAAAAGTTTGTVALVGCGPGRADLLTVRGRELLALADVVVTDRLAPRQALRWVRPDATVVDVGKRRGHHLVPQEEITAMLLEQARAGRFVVRLKGGDPYVFGRGGEEAEACRGAGVTVEVVPGVTSAVAVPAAAGIPVTHRGLSRGFTVLTGHAELRAVPVLDDHTLVVLMAANRLAALCDELVALGHPAGTPAAVVEDGYGPRQRTTTGTLADLGRRAAPVEPPAVLVVGRVVTVSPAWPDG